MSSQPGRTLPSARVEARPYLATARSGDRRIADGKADDRDRQHVARDASLRLAAWSCDAPSANCDAQHNCPSARAAEQQGPTHLRHSASQPRRPEVAAGRIGQLDVGAPLFSLGLSWQACRSA